VFWVLGLGFKVKGLGFRVLVRMLLGSDFILRARNKPLLCALLRMGLCSNKRGIAET